MRLLMFLVVAATLVVTASPAHADREVVRDPTHDVWTEDGGVMPQMVPSDRVVNVDVSRVRVVHGTKAVVVRTKYVDLRRHHPGVTLRLEAELTTDSGRTVFAKVLSAPDDPWGRHLITAEPYAATGALPCAGMRHRISYRRDVVRMVVPRSCLGRPRWIRARVVAAAFTVVVPWIDPVGNGGSGDATWTRRLRRATP